MSNTRWKLIFIPGSLYGTGWTVGKVYRTDSEGVLADDDGWYRSSPERYNNYSMSTDGRKMFSPIVNVENK